MKPIFFSKKIKEKESRKYILSTKRYPFEIKLKGMKGETYYRKS